MNIRNSMMVLAFVASCALAALPSSMLFQGHMPGVSGSKDVSVLLYDALADGSLVWSESQTGVAFNDGYFALQLGSINALPDFDAPLYVALIVDGKTAAARIPLTLSPYAKRAAVADSSVHSFWAASAKLADVASHADKAATAAVATKAINADQAAQASEATHAVSADSAGRADFAYRSTSWSSSNTHTGFGGYPMVFNGVTNSSTVISPPNEGDSLILRTFNGQMNSFYNTAGVYMAPLKPEVRLFTGRALGSSANHGTDSLALTPDSLYSSKDLKFVGSATLDLPMFYTGSSEGDPSSTRYVNGDYPSSEAIPCADNSHLGRLAVSYYTDYLNNYVLWLCAKNTRGGFYWEKMAFGPQTN